MNIQKKIGLFVFSIGFSIFLTNPASASIDYTRTPSGSNITSPVSVSGEIDTFEDLELAEGINYYRISLDMGGESSTEYGTDCYASTTTIFDETYNLSAGQYAIGVMANGYFNEGCSFPPDDQGVYLEGEGDEENPIFHISTIPVVGGIIVMPGNALSSTTEVVGSVFDSIWILLFLAIGVPLAFYVIAKWLKTLP